MERNDSQTLAELAYTMLEERIVTLRLKPGDAINEGAFASELQISRTPVREALIRLEREQLVEIVPRRGIFVTPISIPDHMDLLATRQVLDRLIIATAARRAMPAQLADLSDCAQAMAAAAAANHIEAFMEEDRRFDRIVAEAARNRSASAAVMPLHAHCRRFWYTNRGRGDLAVSARHHGAIMGAILDRDPEQAARCSDLLISYLDEMVRAVLAD